MLPKVSIKTNLISTVTLNYPLLSKIRYVMVYSAKDSAKLDINNPSQIVDKIALKKEKIASASLFHSEKKTLTVPSLH
jgi:hypothetical protein